LIFIKRACGIKPELWFNKIIKDMTTKSILLPALFLSFIATASAKHRDKNYVTNANAPVFSTGTIVINASAEKVWKKLADINNWGKWQPTVSKSKLNGALTANSTFNFKTGKYNIHSTLHTVEPYSRLGWTGKVYGVYAIHNWFFRDIDGKTEVQVSESMQGLLAWMFKKSFNKTLKQDMVQSLELLKQACEGPK
jgi:hypothetical protein